MSTDMETPDTFQSCNADIFKRWMGQMTHTFSAIYDLRVVGKHCAVQLRTLNPHIISPMTARCRKGLLSQMADIAM